MIEITANDSVADVIEKLYEIFKNVSPSSEVGDIFTTDFIEWIEEELCSGRQPDFVKEMARVKAVEGVNAQLCQQIADLTHALHAAKAMLWDLHTKGRI